MDRRQYQSEYREKNREQLLQKKRDYYAQNKAAILVKQAARIAAQPKVAVSRAERPVADPRRWLLYGARARAKKAGLPFDLVLEDIALPESCPVLGIRLSHGVGKFQDSSPTLDRDNPALGYVKGNVQVISHKANRMKNDATREQLVAFANWIIGG